MDLSLDSIIPETGEWTLSPNPNDFIIVLNNDTGLLTAYDRVAVVCQVTDQGDPDSEGRMQTGLGISMLRAVDGRLPGEEIEFSPEGQEFITMVQDRLGPAIDGWATGYTQEQKEAVWAMRADVNPLELLSQILTGKFTA